MAEETNQNQAPQADASDANEKAAGEEAPSITEENITVANSAPDVVVENLKSTTVPEATDMPTANAPDPTAVSSEANPNAAKAAAKKPAAKPAGDAAPKAAAKKEKAPAVEDKPFAEFIQQDFLPALKTGLAKQGVDDLDLKFEKQKIPVIGYAGEPECWQILGNWKRGSRQFRVYFTKEDIQGPRAFSFAENGGKPSTLEPFLIDERKITLDLLVFGVVQRLNAQKWLVRN
jgi:Protein of unknown function (DUF2996)